MTDTTIALTGTAALPSSVPVQVTLDVTTLAAKIAAILSPPVTPPVTPPPPTNPPAGAPIVTAMPMCWKVDFTPVPGAINYAVVDPNQTWLHSQAGSAHLLPAPPILVQGANGAATGSFEVYAQTPQGWVGPSAKAAPCAISGALPAYTDPYWIYHAGEYTWNSDYSFPGGDSNAIDPLKGTAGLPASNDIGICWWDDFPGVSGPVSIGITCPVTGNFAPAITGSTIDLIAHPYAYVVMAINPSYAGGKFNLIWETDQDKVVSNTVELAQYVTAPIPGVFTEGQWNHVNVPMAAMGLIGNTIYKQKIGFEQPGTFHLDNLGFANSPQ